MPTVAFTTIATIPSSVPSGLPSLFGLSSAGNVFAYNFNTCQWNTMPMTSTSTA